MHSNEEIRAHALKLVIGCNFCKKNVYHFRFQFLNGKKSLIIFYNFFSWTSEEEDATIEYLCTQKINFGENSLNIRELLKIKMENLFTIPE